MVKMSCTYFFVTEISVLCRLGGLHLLCVHALWLYTVKVFFFGHPVIRNSADSCLYICEVHPLGVRVIPQSTQLTCHKLSFHSSTGKAGFHRREQAEC